MEHNRGVKRRHPDEVEELRQKRARYKLPDRESHATSTALQIRPGSMLVGDAHINAVDPPRSKYTYSHLDADSIRLLYIEPGDFNDDIRCSLETVKRNESPTYEALSYTWGEPPETELIRVDEAEFYVRPNLYQALQRLRKHSQGRYLWVDAICINQSCIEEKSIQIQKMASVYSSASCVLAWLGADVPNSRLAMDFITRLQDPNSRARERWLDDYGILALGSMLDRPWFMRAWVVQEIASARSALVYYGGRHVRFSALADAVSIVRSRLAEIRVSIQQSPYYSAYERRLSNFEDNSRSIRFLDSLTDLYLRAGDGDNMRPRTNLETLLHNLRGLEATDPRDQIYSFLSIADFSPSTQNRANAVASWVPDYTLSNLEVFTSFVAHCVRTSERLDVIVRPWAAVRKQPWQGDLIDPDLQYAVPSWMAVQEGMAFGDPKDDLRTRVNADSLVGDPNRRTYNAHNGTIAQYHFGIDDVSRKYNGSLYAKGIVLGEVQQASTRMAVGIVLKECLEMIGGIVRGDIGNICDVSDHLWRILCANRDGNANGAPFLYRSSLLQLLAQVEDVGSLDTQELLSSVQDNHVADFLQRVQAVVWDRKIVRSQGRAGLCEDLVGLAPRGSGMGDKIVVLFGCSVPVILRARKSTARGACWELIGEAYMEGVMEGQAVHRHSTSGSMSVEEEFEIR
ncbi:hypothetical protein PG985_011308 [Apiospora marii]|uniref:Heterokaryon incompatibility domain-containing protein n=1 Tax=Apiospora marii TaxID=335849 RepID=A0ABR1STB8_9PEZI